ncbi:hypothetical protein BS47DRAFT_1294272 [Hydnum rufescens UP504]|uniref:Uncharacterized protein n=1 Tax=Hydnum rufescens UP504 TaxID=1448309 RepID=A0A9P6AZX1_9AGAM|nr:hypothetical protein BS47DRAFT_1294272 [Hydnum rufescens UP504]
MTSQIPQEEANILEKLINIRNRLTVLKGNRDEFIKASDVLNLYHAIIKQVTRLNELRSDTEGDPSHMTYMHTSNRVDTMLSDVFSLLSLFFLTIGKGREAPATYCQIASMLQLLVHMNESAVYSESDLHPFQQRVEELRVIIRDDAESGKHPVAMTTLLERKLNKCGAILQSLQESLSELSIELVPVHEKLVHLRRQLATLAAKPKPSKTELKVLQEELRKIDAKRVDGKFLGPGGSSVPRSQAVCSSLLEECFEISQEIRARSGEEDVSFALKPIYDRLWETRAQLESLLMTHRWTLRETDLWNYSLSLQEIDKMRVDGKFVDSEGNKPGGQYVLLYLLRRCYGIIYSLLSSSEPVSEELMPIANKLSTVKKCLNEVLKYGGPLSPRDLYPYQLALHQIESLRMDGKFHSADGSVPEGQGIVTAHLNECHELLEMVRLLPSLYIALLNIIYMIPETKQRGSRLEVERSDEREREHRI